jgi:hypothetical protein
MLKPSIRTKLFIGFFSILGLVVIIFIFSFFQYKQLARITDSLYNHPLKVSNAVREVDLNLVRLHHSIINTAIADSDEAFRKANTNADSSILAITKNFDIVYERFLGEKSMVDSAYSGFEGMLELKKQVVNIREEHGIDEAIVFSRKNLSDKLKSTVVHTKAIADFASDKANTFYTDSIERMKYFQNWMVGISLFLIITGIFIAIRLSNRISRPILNFARETYHLMHGENVKIPSNPSEETLLSIITEELKSNYEKLRNELVQKELAEKTIREQYEKINKYSAELTILNEDLEERAKLKAQELFKSERNFKQLFNGINDAVFVYEMERGLIGPAQLARMKPDAVLINVARGPVADEEALYQALRDGVIGGAVLDTWYRYASPAEPDLRPSRQPFHKLQNVVMTPHLSGWTEGLMPRRLAVIIDNIERLADGRPLRHQVHAPT